MEEEIEDLLRQINDLQVHMQQYTDVVKYQSMLRILVGIYTMYLLKIFYKNNGLVRTDIRATDLLLVVYAAALIS